MPDNYWKSAAAIDPRERLWRCIVDCGLAGQRRVATRFGILLSSDSLRFLLLLALIMAFGGVLELQALP